MAEGLLDIISPDLLSNNSKNQIKSNFYTHEWIKICDTKEIENEEIFSKSRIKYEINPTKINWRKEKVLDLYTGIINSVIKIQRFYKIRYFKRIFPFT